MTDIEELNGFYNKLKTIAICNTFNYIAYHITRAVTTLKYI